MGIDYCKSNEYYGLKWIWFTGRVIRRYKDPLKLGRVFLEIPGVTPLVNPKKPPKSDKAAKKFGLLLASVSGPSESTIGPPKEGSVVYGFFLNTHGNVPQEPVIMGVLPSIKSAQSRDIYFKSGIKLPISTQPHDEVGQPTVVPMAQGKVKDTLTSRLNKALEHSCDGATQLWGAVKLAKQLNAFVTQGVNAVVKYFTESKGNDKTGIMSKIVDRIKDISTFVNWLTKQVKMINDFIAGAVEVAKMIRLVYDYIMLFPARILEFIKDCLNKLALGVNNFLQEAFSTSGFENPFAGGESPLMAEFKNLMSASSGLMNEISNTSTTVSNVTTALTTPSSSTDLANFDDKATVAMDSAISTTVNTASSTWTQMTSGIGARQQAVP